MNEGPAVEGRVVRLERKSGKRTGA